MREQLKPRRAWLALLLGLLWPGLGQLYSARPWRALAAIILTLFVIVPAATELPMVLSWSFHVSMVGYFTALTLLLLVPIDGALVARLTRGIPRSRWNNIWIYILYVVLMSLLLTAEYSWLPRHLPLRRFRVPTGAMKPTLLIGDVIIADMREKSRRSTDLGDILVFQAPEEPDKLWVKRLAGLPGDTVEVRDGFLILNGQRRGDPDEYQGNTDLFRENLGDHEYQIRITSLSTQENFGPAVVPPGKLFMLGDNRHHSRDSRAYGFIPVTSIRGRAIGIHWSQVDEPMEVRWNRIGATLVRQ